MNYTKFISMIVTSTVVMFGLMYLNTYALGHIQFSETRTYMALYMGAVMAVIMLLFMWGMYKKKAFNTPSSDRAWLSLPYRSSYCDHKQPFRMCLGCGR